MHLYERDRSWFAIQVRPRHELSTAQILQNKGFEKFVPMYKSRRQWSDRCKTVAVPLFTGYVFCRFSPNQKLPIVTTPGVIRVVGASKGCAPIADHEIEAIQKITAAGRNVEPHPYLNLTVGSPVRVEEGPLAGCEGILLSHKSSSKLIISIDLIQKAMSVEIEGYAVVPINDATDWCARRPCINATVKPSSLKLLARAGS
jgi:transcription antitermination factor NusG